MLYQSTTIPPTSLKAFLKSGTKQLLPGVLLLIRTSRLVVLATRSLYIWTDKLQNTNLPIPIPSPTAATPHEPKTLPHAVSRAAKSGATQLGAEDRLGVALGIYGAALEKV